MPKKPRARRALTKDVDAQDEPAKQQQQQQAQQQQGQQKDTPTQKQIKKELEDLADDMPAIDDTAEFLKRVDAFLKNETKISWKRGRISLDELAFFMQHYFDEKTGRPFFGLGRDRIFYLVKTKYPDSGLTRRKINRILQAFLLVQLMNPKKRTTDIKKQIQTAPGKLVEMDLLDNSNLASPNGYKWLLNAVDSFSKYGFSIPMKDKSEATVTSAFHKLLKQMKEVLGKSPSTILTDNGSEFINGSMKKIYEDNGIKHILTKAKSEASHAKTVERFNLYLRRAQTRFRTQFDRMDFENFIPLILKNYNSTPSRVTKKPPEEIVKQGTDPKSQANEETKEQIKKSILPKNNKDEIIPYKVGDTVRIKVELANDFEHPSNNISYSKEKFKVSKVKNAKAQSQLQPVYRVMDEQGKEVKEDFYHHALRKVNANVLVGVQEPEKFVIQKILDEKKKKDNTGKYRRYLLIKWKGYKEPTFEPYSVIQNDVPKMVANYEKTKGSKPVSKPQNPPDQPVPQKRVQPSRRVKK